MDLWGNRAISGQKNLTASRDKHIAEAELERRYSSVLGKYWAESRERRTWNVVAHSALFQAMLWGTGIGYG